MRGVEEGKKEVLFSIARVRILIKRSVTAKTRIYIYLSFATLTCPHLPISAPIHIECPSAAAADVPRRAYRYRGEL